MPENSENQSEFTRPDVPSSAAALSANVRLHLGKQLRALYGDPAEDKLPRDLARLVDRVAQVIRAHTEPVDQEFVNGVMDALPILRNGFYSTHRKTSREVEDGDGTHAASMIAIPDQEDKLALQDLSSALDKLPQEQREAIILIGAEGMSYEDAAEALGVKVGTIKSRVNRARNRLAELMGTSRVEHDHSATA